MDALEFAKAKQLRKIAEARLPEPIADFAVKRLPNNQFVTAANGSLTEIAMMITNGIHDIEEQYPEARMIFSLAFREYLEG